VDIPQESKLVGDVQLMRIGRLMPGEIGLGSPEGKVSPGGAMFYKPMESLEEVDDGTEKVVHTRVGEVTPKMVHLPFHVEIRKTV
tara:strand:+ start:189 stop:443 length:255 start_codon:yes stop_codon:yes gene_type:complete